MDAHVGLRKTVGIAAAVVLALSVAAVPGARSAFAAEAGASEEYRVTGSSILTYSARIVASEDYLTKRVCDDFADRLRAVFGLAKDPNASYTGATYDGGTSECAVQPFDIYPTDSVITENGSEYTVAMLSSTTGPVLAAIGFTTRSATATVSNAIITSASDGCAIDHDSPDRRRRLARRKPTTCMWSTTWQRGRPRPARRAARRPRYRPIRRPAPGRRAQARRARRRLRRPRGRSRLR